jgi:inosine-uridine nucleoside N-ribohydrolase
MMGLDVTLQVVLDGNRSASYGSLTTQTATMFNASMAHYIEACRRHGSEYPAMHDPCCIAYIADPSIFTTESHDIEIELHDREKYGRTYAGTMHGSGTTQVGVGVDADRFWKLLDRAFSRLP